MRRVLPAVVATSLLAAAALPSTASATKVEIGQTSTPIVAPTCPPGTTAASCTILLTHTTGLESLSDSTANPTLVKQDGVLTSLTVGISSAARNFVASLDKNYGGAPQVDLTVLRPIGAGKANRWEVAASSNLQNLTAYQGSVVEFPLGSAIPVVPGEVLALSTPTWAPILSIDLSKTAFAYRQPFVPVAPTTGGPATCPTQPSLATPLVIGNENVYGCAYTGTRIEYTASEVTTPTPTASFRMARRIDRLSRRPHVLHRSAR